MVKVWYNFVNRENLGKHRNSCNGMPVVHTKLILFGELIPAAYGGQSGTILNSARTTEFARLKKFTCMFEKIYLHVWKRLARLKNLHVWKLLARLKYYLHVWKNYLHVRKTTCMFRKKLLACLKKTYFEILRHFELQKSETIPDCYDL